MYLISKIQLGDEKGKILKLLKLDKLFENLTGYVETQIELIKLDVKDQAAESIQKLIQVIVIMLFAFIFIIFISIAIAIGINTLVDSNFLGYLIISILYLIISLAFVLDKNTKFGKWIYSKFIESKE